MAYNFTLQGLASVVNFGKGNATVVGASGTQLRARDATNAADVNMSGADPVAVNDFTTKQYVDNLALGLSWKEPVRVASTANVTIATPGAAIDGVTLALGNRVLLKNQTVPTENGIYVYDTATTPLVRSTDMPTGADAANDAMFVSEGTTQADQAYVETADPAIVGTDPLTFLQFASVTSGVTSISSVDNGGGAGTFASVVLSGAAPVPTIRSISNGSQIAAVESTNEVALSIVANSVTETDLAPGPTLTRYLQVTFADFPATPSSANLNLGAIMPASAYVQGGIIVVTTPFDNAPTLQIGVAADLNAVFAAAENDLLASGTYASSNASLYTAGTQLLARATTVTAQPTVGVAELLVNFSRFA